MVSEILTVTLNPALDIATETERVVAGSKLRCTQPRENAGGGGVNISRAIHYLGGRSQALVALGGFNGQRLQADLAAEQIDIIAFDSGGETRQSFAVTDNTHQQFRFVLPGPEWTPPVIEQALQAIDQALKPNSLLVMSGSFPPGVSEQFIRELQNVTQDKRAKLMVDTSGEVLSHLLTPPVNLDILRMDKAESEMLSGRALASHADAADFAQSLVDAGVANMVIMARGKQGNCLVTKDKKLFASCSVNTVVSAIGAGDSFVGGFVMALAKGKTTEEALLFGTASASAAVQTKATELCNRSLVEKMLPKSVLTVF